jgi:hypothetical protein
LGIEAVFDWLFGSKRKAMAPDPPHVFPFPVQAVPATRAIAVYDAIKAQSQGLPLFLGGPEDVANLAHMAALSAQSRPMTQEALNLAAVFDFPRECWKFADGTIPDVHDDIAHLRANPGPWPDKVEAMTTLPVLMDLRTGKPRETIHIATIPTQDNSAIPAFLNFGGWNACPYPHVFVAALRKWKSDWNAELVSMTSDTMDIRFLRKPETREAAIGLYLEMVALHSDTLMDGDPSEHAATSMVSEYWQFWWD